MSDRVGIANEADALDNGPSAFGVDGPGRQWRLQILLFCGMIRENLYTIIQKLNCLKEKGDL